MGRRPILLLVAIGVGVLLAGEVALAATPLACPEKGGLCEGTTGDDDIIGTSFIDDIYAKEGNDVLRGLGAHDDLRGGLGNDTYTIENNWGNDFISGGRSGAKDWLVFQISAGSLTTDLKPSSTRDEVSSGANTINLAPDVVIEWVQAGPGSDIIKGVRATTRSTEFGAGTTSKAGKATTRLWMISPLTSTMSLAAQAMTPST